ncbi:hypothetical protein QCA50_001522 [Cerrena zonata]|uniref:Uncharacterized protein n=1 Tax=Cerrena zonata TaxID=2478898 RepID=A0AAW0GTH9_9APHY
MEAASPSDSKRVTDGELEKTDDSQSIAPKRPLNTETSRKRQQNNSLLWRAMRTTAVHATQTFTVPSGVSDQGVPESPTAGSGTAVTTPGAIPPRAPTPRTASNAPTPAGEGPSVKGPPGAGKKKKKRTSIAPPTG